MMYKKITYKWQDIYSIPNVVIDDVNINVSTRSNQRPVQTYHWSVSWPTLWTFRLITVTGRLYGENKLECENAKKELDKIINLEGIPFINIGHYDFEWIGDDSTVYTTRAKVQRIPSYTRDANWFYIWDFSFELLAEDIRYYKKTKNISTYTDAFGTIWWFDVKFDMPFQIDKIKGSFMITNNWNFQSSCKITISWAVSNPKVVNLDNNRFFWIEWLSNELVIDNTGNTLTVTDSWNDVSLQRMQGSSEIFLSTGANNFVLLWTSWDTVDITIEFRDTFTSN